jgi:flagellar hook-length control protein FliK
MSTVPSMPSSHASTAAAGTSSSSSSSSSGASGSAGAPDESAMGAFASLIALLKEGGAAASSDELPETREAGKQWMDGDKGPDALWASVWFPTATPTQLPLPLDGAALAAAATLTAKVGDAAANAGGATPLSPAVLAATDASPAAADGTTTTPTTPTPDAATPTKAEAALPNAADLAAALAAASQGIAPGKGHAETAVAVAQHAVDMTRADAPQRIAEQVVWAIGEKISEVRLELHPQDLGAIDVKLRLEGDKVQVEFASGDAKVRDVVQTSLPNLSSLLQAQGLQLDHAQVFAPKAPVVTPMFGTQSPQNSTSTIVNTGPTPLIRRMRRAGLLDDYV